MNLELHGKRVLITGASRGIGLGTAKALAQEGCGIHMVARTLPDLEVVADELRRLYGCSVTPYCADLTEAASVQRLIKACPAIGSAERMDDLTAEMPFGRLAAVRGIADSIAFLASPRASYISGTVVTTDGGASAPGDPACSGNHHEDKIQFQNQRRN